MAVFLISGLVNLLKIIRDQAEADYYDESAALQELLRIRLSYELGDIDAAEYRHREEQIMQRIASIQEYRRQAAEDDGDE